MASSSTSLTEPPPGSPAVIAVMGPTASGKSALALALAERLGGEIVSADSMQLYRGLDIGTAKPSPEERRKAPHHLLDVLDIAERSDLFRFRDMAWEAVSSIRERGKVPIVAGGTGLYLRALIYGLDPMPSDQALRAELDALYDSEEGFEKLKERMASCDPAALARWGSHRRKLIRALETLLLSGKSISELQTAWPKAKPRPDVLAFKLSWPNAALKERIASRCSDMLRSGWIEEAEAMIAKGLLQSPTARQALGYSTIGEFLSGRVGREEMEERIATATWQFARRQGTWFRNQHPEAFEIAAPASPDAAAKAIVDSFSKSES